LVCNIQYNDQFTDWKSEVRLPAWKNMLRFASAFKPNQECNYPTTQRQPGIQRPRVKQTIHLHLVTRLRVRAATLPHRIHFQFAVPS